MLRLRSAKVRSWAGRLQTLQNCFYRYSNVNKSRRFNNIWQHYHGVTFRHILSLSTKNRYHLSTKNRYHLSTKNRYHLSTKNREPAINKKSRTSYQQKIANQLSTKNRKFSGICLDNFVNHLSTKSVSPINDFANFRGFFAPPIWTEFFALSVCTIYSYAYRKYQKSEKPLVNY